MRRLHGAEHREPELRYAIGERRAGGMALDPEPQAAGTRQIDAVREIIQVSQRSS